MLSFTEKCILSAILCCKHRKVRTEVESFSPANCCENRKDIKTEMEEFCHGRNEKLRRSSSESAEKYTIETLNSVTHDDLAFFTPRTYFHTVSMENDTEFFTPRAYFHKTDMYSDPEIIHTSLFEIV